MTEPTQQSELKVQPDQVNTGGLVKAMILLAILIVASMFACVYFEDFFSGRIRAESPTSHPMSQFRESPKGPLLQALPNQHYQQFAEQQRHELQRYGWIDRDAGTVQIPVEQARAALLKENAFPVSPTLEDPR